MIAVAGLSCSGERNLPADASIALTPANVNVSSVDVYQDGDAIHLLTAESHSEKDTPALQYRRTPDGGVTWSEPVRVDKGSPPPHGPHRGMDVQIAASGSDIVAAWTTAGTGWGGGGPLTTAISSDGGKSWRPGANPADDNTTAGHGFVDIAASRGGFDMVWLDERRGKQGLRHARSTNGGKQWDRNATIDAETCECCWNTLAHDSNGALCALYRDIGPRDMTLARLDDGKA